MFAEEVSAFPRSVVGGRNIACGVDSMDAELHGDLTDCLVGLGMLRQSDESSAGTQDAGLFACDLGDGVPEIVLMIERDIRDDGEERTDDVGGIEPAAQPNLEDGDVNEPD